MAYEISKFCECGCGEVVTERYKYNDSKTGAKKGELKRFIAGHAGFKKVVVETGETVVEFDAMAAIMDIAQPLVVEEAEVTENLVTTELTAVTSTHTDGRRKKRKNHTINQGGRTCGCCGEFKPWVEYYKNASHGTGHKTICKGCDQAASERWRQKHPERVKAASGKGDRLTIRHRANGKVYEVHMGPEDTRYAEVLVVTRFPNE